MAGMKKTSKPAYITASPFRPPKVSQLEQPHHDVIIELLVRLLSPIGQHRQNLPKPSAKRGKKRKRNSTTKTTSDQSSEPAKARDNDSKNEAGPPPPVVDDGKTGNDTSLPPSPVTDYCLLGFNSVTRHLEDLSKYSSKQPPSKGTRPRHISAVFLLRRMDDLIYSHLPLLCQTASLAYPDLPPTRLVLLDPSVEPKITEAVAHVRGVSVLALVDDLEDAAGSKALVEYVRENVKAVDVPWLKQIADGQWLGATIEVK